MATEATFQDKRELREPLFTTNVCWHPSRKPSVEQTSNQNE